MSGGARRCPLMSGGQRVSELWQCGEDGGRKRVDGGRHAGRQRNAELRTGPRSARVCICILRLRLSCSGLAPRIRNLSGRARAALQQMRALTLTLPLTRTRTRGRCGRRGALEEERVQAVEAELRARVCGVLVLTELTHAATVQLHRAGGVEVEPVEALSVRREH